MSLNDLFVQILESEQKARERNNLFNEIKSKISASNHDLQSIENEANKLELEVTTKVQELAAEELHLQWINMKESILNEQLAELSEQNLVCNQELSQLRSAQIESKEEFQAEVSVFCQHYGLTGNGQDHRLTATKEEVKKLQGRQKQLEEELAVFCRQTDLLQSMEDEKMAAEREISQIKHDMKELGVIFDKKKAETKQLEVKKAEVTGKPHSDREFKRLQAELDACRDDSLEGLCQALHHQIDQLQRHQWQQQLQQQRQHQAVTVATQRQQDNHRRNSQELNAAETSYTKGTATPSSRKPNLAKLKSALKRQTEDN